MSMSPGAIGAIVHGLYLGAIQRALGSPGATATVDISGRPSPGPAVVISLSPKAQQALSDDRVALELIERSRSGGKPAAQHATSHAGLSQIQSSDAATTTPIAAAGTALSSPTASVEDLKAEARAAMTDPEAVFRAAIDANQGDWATVLSFRGDEDRQAFQAAYANGTITFQNASDVEGLDYRDNTVITGTSENAHISQNNDWRAEMEKETNTYSGLLCFPIVGAEANSNPSSD